MSNAILMLQQEFLSDGANRCHADVPVACSSWASLRLAQHFVHAAKTCAITPMTDADTAKMAWDLFRKERAEDALRPVTEWRAWLPERNPGLAERIQTATARLTWKQAAERADLWHKALAKRRRDDAKDDPRCRPAARRDRCRPRCG
jgi:hypothetical protein